MFRGANSRYRYPAENEHVCFGTAFRSAGMQHALQKDGFVLFHAGRCIEDDSPSSSTPIMHFFSGVGLSYRYLLYLYRRVGSFASMLCLLDTND